MLFYCINLIVNILIWILVVQAILSWFVNPYGRGASRVIASIYRGISSFTYPLTLPARHILSRVNTGPMDLSLILTCLLLILIRTIVFRLLV